MAVALAGRLCNAIYSLRWQTNKYDFYFLRFQPEYHGHCNTFTTRKEENSISLLWTQPSLSFQYLGVSNSVFWPREQVSLR